MVAETSSVTKPIVGVRGSPGLGTIAAAALLALAAIPVGLLAAAVRDTNVPGEAAAAEALVPIVAWCLLLILAALTQRQIRGSTLAWSLVGGTVVLSAAVAVYVCRIESVVRFPADFLTWSESPFVQDIIHLRTGRPLYEPPDALSSFFYPPLTQILTYGVAALFGAPNSIPLYRIIQLGWIVMAAAVGVLVLNELLTLVHGRRDGLLASHRVLAIAFALLLLFLVGTNPITSSFAHNLHNDSLATLISVVAFWLLTRYARTRDDRLLVPLAVLPAVGFMVKQNLAIWAFIVPAAVLLLGGPRAVRKTVLLGVVGLGLSGAAHLLGLLLWGDAWSFWIVKAMGSHPISPLRVVEHVAQSWVFPGALIVAGLALIRSSAQRELIVLWGVSFGLYLVHVYTSGIAWMLNHMAPSSLLAGVWLLAALYVYWPRVLATSEQALPGRLIEWSRALAMVVMVALLVGALGAVRPPVAELPVDAQRYRRDIEREVEGMLQQNQAVLLDHGSWVFLPSGLSIGDRSAAAGELGGASQMSEFEGLLQRIRAGHYARILVRDFDSPNFFYDHQLWSQSSGIRAALHEHYRVVRVIPAVDGENRAYFKAISVLEPAQ